MPISLKFAEQEKTKMNKASQNLSLFLAIFKKTTLSSAQAAINKYTKTPVYSKGSLFVVFMPPGNTVNVQRH